MTRAVAAACALALATGCAGTPLGKRIDDQCVAGRLSEDGAAFLNATPEAWEKVHRDFSAPIRKNDRVLSRYCSEALIAFAEKDWEQFVEAVAKMQSNDD